MVRSTRLYLLTALILLLLIPVTAIGQGTTGTIRGRVTDLNTGQPLPAVNVSVLETDGSVTSMGTFTSSEGEYVIINVPPDRYRLRATMVGYSTLEATNLLVKVGVSTIHHFQMEQTVLDVGSVVTVSAERDVIQRDVSSTLFSYTIEEMEQMVISNTTEILELQSNTIALKEQFEANLDALGEFSQNYYKLGLESLSMRGGRRTEIGFMIDGMQVTNLVYGGQAAQVSPFSLSEMVVMAGGMSAEFGNAMSGVVNMVTREGGKELDASIELLSSEFSRQPQDDVRDLTKVQGYIGGPIKIIPGLTFILSGSASSSRDYVIKKDDIVFDLYVNPTADSTRHDDIRYQMPVDWDDFDPDNPEWDPYVQHELKTGHEWPIHPMDIYSGYLGYGFNNQWSVMSNMTYRFSPTKKLTFSGSLDGSWRAPFSPMWRFSMLWGIPTDIQTNCIWGTERWDANTTRIDSTQPERIIDLTGQVDWHNEKNILFLNNSRIAFVWTHQLNPSTFYSLRGSYYDYNQTMRVKRWINEDGYAARFEHLYPPPGQDTTWHQGDPMTQVTLLPIAYDDSDDHARRFGYVTRETAGLGWDSSDINYTNQFDITRMLRGDITSQLTTHHQVKTGFQYAVPTLDLYQVAYPDFLVPLIQKYRWTPWELGLYIQNKIEYDWIILNLGVRYDAGHAGKIPYWLDPRNPTDKDGNLIESPYNPEFAPITTNILRNQLSPRMGISHPVTERSVVYFNYGHFFQLPTYDQLYLSNSLAPLWPHIGNPMLESEKTIAYEFGYKHQLTDIYSTEFVMWAKDTANMVGSEVIPARYQGVNNPYEYSVFINYDYAHSKGIDLTLAKRYSSNWQARVSYSFMSTQSNRDDPYSGTSNRETLESSPKRPRVLNWDQPHRINASISMIIPEGSGPVLLGFRPLERVTLNLTYRAAAGMPYTPTSRGRMLELNSGRLPWTYCWNGKIYRDFDMFGFQSSIFLDVRNIFDRRNVRLVYSRSGKPDDPGSGENQYSDHYDRSWYYEQPRRIELGIRFYF